MYARGNKALRNGGALAFINSVAGASVQVLDGWYEDNMAYR